MNIFDSKMKEKMIASAEKFADNNATAAEKIARQILKTSLTHEQ